MWEELCRVAQFIGWTKALRLRLRAAHFHEEPLRRIFGTMQHRQIRQRRDRPSLLAVISKKQTPRKHITSFLCLPHSKVRRGALSYTLGGPSPKTYHWNPWWSIPYCLKINVVRKCREFGRSTWWEVNNVRWKHCSSTFNNIVHRSFHHNVDHSICQCN